MIFAAVGKIFFLYFLWRWFGRGHGVIGIVVIVVLALVLFLGARMIRRRRGFY